jgi:hypothetical protein
MTLQKRRKLQKKELWLPVVHAVGEVEGGTGGAQVEHRTVRAG